MVTRLCDYVGKLGKHHNLNILVMDEDLFISFNSSAIVLTWLHMPSIVSLH